MNVIQIMCLLETGPEYAQNLARGVNLNLPANVSLALKIVALSIYSCF